MKRQEYFEQRYSEPLERKVRLDMTSRAIWYRSRGSETLVDIFLSYDPTRGKRFTSWLIDAYLRDGFLAEDLSKAKETLELFDANWKRLAGRQRDIGSYKTLADLWIAVKRFRISEVEDLSVSGKKKKRQEKQSAYEQSIILLDTSDVTIAIPTTIDAAKWWGRGTRWCTAADKDNAFSRYHLTAPLIVIDLKEHGKFQMYAHWQRFHLMNADDSAVDNETIKQHWAFFEKLIRWAVSQCGNVLEYVPPERMDYELCREAVCNQRGVQGEALGYVPDAMKDEALIKLAVSENGFALGAVPVEMIDYDLCKIAVASRGVALRHVPAPFRDVELCKLAVSQNGHAIHYVPADIIDYDLCQLAVCKTGCSLRDVPEHYQDEKLYRSAVIQDGYALIHVPSSFRTYELCEIAVRNYGPSINSVPNNLLDVGLYRLAVEKSGTIIRVVPRSVIDHDLCVLAIKCDGWALGYIPDEFKSREICRSAVANSPYALRFVPQNLRDYETCCIAVAQRPNAFEFVPKRLRSSVREYMNSTGSSTCEYMNSIGSPTCDWIGDATFVGRLKAVFSV